VPDSNNALILEELRALRTDVNTFARQIGERVATLESKMYTLVDNGQPGRITLLERDLRELAQWRWKMLGITTGVSGIISCIAWAVVELRK
jgi:hypothetical protein